jgi:translation initiation factor IF-2
MLVAVVVHLREGALGELVALVVEEQEGTTQPQEIMAVKILEEEQVPRIPH